LRESRVRPAVISGVSAIHGEVPTNHSCFALDAAPSPQPEMPPMMACQPGNAPGISGRRWVDHPEPAPLPGPVNVIGVQILTGQILVCLSRRAVQAGTWSRSPWTGSST
jgi:hypothetical protein